MVRGAADSGQAAAMDWRQHLREGAAALSQADHHQALQLCDRAAQAGEEARYFAALLRGDVLLSLGDPTGALSAYETVAELGVPDPAVDCGRGMALFELGRFPEAENALLSAVKDRPDLPDAFFALGVMAEYAGRGCEAEFYRQARRLDPVRFAPRPQLSRDGFEHAVWGAVESLEGDLSSALSRVAVVVCEMPHPADLGRRELLISPLSLGFFVVQGGAPKFASLGCCSEPQVRQGAFPTLVVFKRNLERISDSFDHLVVNIGGVILAEAGRILGQC